MTAVVHMETIHLYINKLPQSAFVQQGGELVALPQNFTFCKRKKLCRQ